MFFWVLGCSMSSPSTLVDELRVMAIQTEPAELSPLDQEASLRLLIAEPQDRAVDVMYWTCTNIGNGCLEAEFFADDLTQWPQVFSRTELLTEREFRIPPALSGVVDSLPEDAVPFYGTILWVLACLEDECSFIRDAKQNDINPQGLSNPFEIINDLPFGVASLAFSSIPISNRPLEERVQNPEIVFVGPEELQQNTEETLELEFSYTLNTVPNEDSLIYGYATLGGFSESSRSNAQLQQEAGSVSLSWFASQEVGQGEAYVVLENGVGGTGIWFADVEVQQP